MPIQNIIKTILWWHILIDITIWIVNFEDEQRTENKHLQLKLSSKRKLFRRWIFFTTACQNGTAYWTNLALQLTSFMTLLCQTDGLIRLKVAEGNTQRRRRRTRLTPLTIFANLNGDPEAVTFARIEAVDRAVKLLDFVPDHDPLGRPEAARLEGVVTDLLWVGYFINAAVFPDNVGRCALEVLNARYAWCRWYSWNIEIIEI